ncbi:MAG: alginate O-acetyltransferase AlgX-related protein [Spirochaetaceae bacterium]
MKDTRDNTPLRNTVPATFLLTLAAGMLFTAVALARMELPKAGSLLSGERSATFESRFETALPVYEPALNLWTALRYTVFGEGDPPLVVGTEEWFFLAEELEAFPEEGARLAEAENRIAQAARQLAERDAALAVVIVPSKARLYADKLPPRMGTEVPGDVDRRLPAVSAALEEARGTELPPETVLVDAHRAMREARAAGTEVYLRTDTHWTPEGAAAVAEAAASAARPTLERHDVNRMRFVTEAGETVAHEGDLLRFLPLGPFADTLGPTPDSVRRYETRAAEGNDGAAGGSLLDDPEIPVTLVGTSYSAGELWNFAGALKSALEADVLSVAAEGEGPFAPMEEYLDSEIIDDQPPRLVVWEIPERYLPRLGQVGDGGRGRAGRGRR